jgi:DNA-binding transcriptional MerR regulator
VETRRSYTLSELEERSGFDKRTIAYYVQEGLLPKVGRRGRWTRYPDDVLDRLLFIRRVRDLQDAGRLRAVTLSEIREVMAGQSRDEIREAAAENVSPERLRSLFTEPDLDTSDRAVPAEDVAAMLEHVMAPYDDALANDSPVASRASARRASLERRMGSEGPSFLRAARARPPRSSAAAIEDDRRMGELLREIDESARRGARPSEHRTRERLIRVPITDAVYLAARNIDEDDAGLVEELAALLRKKGEGEEGEG